MGENELPDSWIWAKLESITKRIGDVDHKMPAAVTSGIPYISTKNFYGEDGIDFSAAKHVSREDYLALSHKIKPEAGDILLSRYGTVGEIRKVSTEIEFQASYSIAIIKMFSVPYLSDFLVYALKSDVVQKQIKRDIRATAQPDLGLEYIRQFQIPLAPLHEQQRIVAAIEQQFTRLDVGVAALKNAQKRLKRYWAAVLKAAVEGKLTEAWRDEHSSREPASLLLERILVERRAKWEVDLRAKGKDPTKVEYIHPMKPDLERLSDLPEGWCWATLDELSYHITSGSRGWAQYYADSGNLFIRVGNFNRLDTKIDLQKVVYVRVANTAEANRCRLQVGDLLITITADVGMVGVVDEHIFQWGDAFINQHVGLVRFLYPELSAFVASALASEPLQAQIRKKQYGATKTGLGLEDLKSLAVPLAPLDEQQYICTEIERRTSLVQYMGKVIQANLTRAERMRQSILKEAFAGRLVPQDPDDELASVLLERIRQEREAHGERKQGNGKKVREKGSPKRQYVTNMVEQEPEPLDSSELEQVALWHGIAD